MKKKVEISQEEVQKALQKFQKEGGLINKLPDQIAPRSTMVGGRFSMYETVSERQNAEVG